MIELARLHNGEDVYGTYEEVEDYAEKNDTCVTRYYDHVNPVSYTHLTLPTSDLV